MSALRALYRGENDFDIVGKFKVGIILSLVLLGISVASLGTRELNLGIDFEGGAAFLVPSADTSVADARDALRPLGLENAKIQVLGTGDSRTLRAQTAPLEEVSDVSQEDVAEALAELEGVSVEEVSITDVGPSWGNEITNKAVRALVFFLIAIAVYITLRFEWKMAAATLLAVGHDVLISVGVYSVFQFEVTPATVIAFLTILGYSLYDGIVVFDKINENSAVLSGGTRVSYGQMVNLSINEVLMRSINTSISSVLPVLSMLVVGSILLGAATLQEFALALLVGILTGAYSSIFVASPALIWLKEREPRFAERAARDAARSDGRRLGPPTGDADDAVTVGAEPPSPAAGARPAGGVRSAPIAPRPRKKRRR